jgi:hypothetical protein
VKTKRGRAIHHSIPYFSTNDRLASYFKNFPPPVLYFSKMVLSFLIENVTFYKHAVSVSQRVNKKIKLCHSMLRKHGNGKKIILNMFYSVFIKNANDFYTM